MSDETVHSPVRIQIWLPNSRIEFRGWTDLLEITRDLPPRPLQDFRPGFWVNGTTHIELKAHVGVDIDQPWKFKKGRPNV